MLNQSMLIGIYQSLKSTIFKKVISLIVIALLLVSLAALWESRKENNWNNIEDGATIVSKELPKVALISIAKAASSDKTKNEVTVYNQNLALVKEYRTMDLSSGNNIIKYVDVASQIDPTSVMFKDPKSQNTVVVEQNYEYDLVSSDKLLDKYLDKEITVTSDNESFTGKLLSRSGGITLQTQKGVVVLNNIMKIEYPDSAGLLTKPTLIWQIYTDSSGSREVETTYLTGGMNWKANYIATIDQSDSKANINGWVTIENNAGTVYPDAKLKLVAGDINRVEVPQIGNIQAGAPTATPTIVGVPFGFTQEGLFEYHLYTLQRPTTLNNNEIKQISLLSADDVPAKKEYSYDGERDGEKVRVALNITNSKENNLGMPMPKGVVRVYKADSDGQLQFLGEDSIDHTPKDEALRINVGNAFDIVGKRTVTDSEAMGSNGNHRDSYSIELKNHKTEDVKIIVTEHPSGSTWLVTKASEQYKKKDANTIEFEVNVPKNDTKTITYTAEIRY